MDGWMDGWMLGWMNGWMDGCWDGWMDGWMDGWTHRGLDVCMDELIHKMFGLGWANVSTFTHKSSRQVDTHSLSTCFVTGAAPGVGGTWFLPACGLPSKEWGQRGSKRVSKASEEVALTWAQMKKGQP